MTDKVSHSGTMIPTMADRTILHVDLDAFFASVEQRDRPELRGRPVIVGGEPGSRGVVSAASYEARVFGVCPDGVFLPVDGRRYQQASRDVMAILRRFTPQMEPISIDEAFLDVTGSRALFGDGPEIAALIKTAVRTDVGLTASVGVASNKLVAKVGSDLRKPDGLVVVPAGEEAAFLAPLPIGRLWGVGAKTAVVLADYGVRTIGDLAALPANVIESRFGKHGASLAERARGIDTDPVHEGDPAKSVGHEHTFDVDTTDREIIERTLLAMADGVGGRLRSAGVRAGTIAIRLRDSSFDTISRQKTLPEPTDMTERIFEVALGLARPEVAAIRARGGKVRLLGVTGSNLGEREQLGLFDTDDPRRRKAIQAADAVRRRYGDEAMTRARLLDAKLPAPFERDPRNPLDRRARGVPTEGDPDQATSHPSRDSQGDADLDDIPPDDA